jgi:hypothetical protein
LAKQLQREVNQQTINSFLAILFVSFLGLKCVLGNESPDSSGLSVFIAVMKALLLLHHNLVH